MTPRQIVILRHAEKPEDPRDPDLSPAGERRASMLATLIPQRFPNPDFLFAAARSNNSNRPAETIAPLAGSLGLKLNADIADQDFEVLAADLLNQPKYNGKLIIVCWHHGHIPGLALSLGVTQVNLTNAPGMIGLGWDPEVFDRFWVLGFDGTPNVSFSSVLQT